MQVRSLFLLAGPRSFPPSHSVLLCSTPVVSCMLLSALLFLVHVWNMELRETCRLVLHNTQYGTVRYGAVIYPGFLHAAVSSLLPSGWTAACMRWTQAEFPRSL